MATYPNEAYPADAAIEALDGIVHAPSGLVYVAKGVGPNSSPTYEVQYNRRLARQNAILAVVNQGRVVDEGGLNIGVFPIVYYHQQVRKSFDGATGQALADNATRYVWINATNQLYDRRGVSGGHQDVPAAGESGDGQWRHRLHRGRARGGAVSRAGLMKFKIQNSKFKKRRAWGANRVLAPHFEF